MLRKGTVLTRYTEPLLFLSTYKVHKKYFRKYFQRSPERQTLSTVHNFHSWNVTRICALRNIVYTIFVMKHTHRRIIIIFPSFSRYHGTIFYAFELRRLKMKDDGFCRHPSAYSRINARETKARERDNRTTSDDTTATIRDLYLYILTLLLIIR